MILSLEKQVCSLESNKRLKELGFPQESLFYWIQEPTHEKNWVLKNHEEVDFFVGKENAISAYTVAELGILLPENSGTRNQLKIGLKRYTWEQIEDGNFMRITKHKPEQKR